ncbi:ACP S-malonyltransferase [bacterium]|nr:ACP S-malonyltransferase [bacterium]
MKPDSAKIRKAFLFPGQGSQFVGMGRDLFERSEIGKSCFESAGRVLGTDIATVCFNGPEEKLKETRHTQPALVIHSTVACRLLAGRGIVPDCAAGHSLGEFSALIAAGALSFEKGLALVRERSLLMQDAGSARPGAMAAVIGLAPDAVEEICVEARQTGTVQPANYNSPEQTVISGSPEGVARASEIARGKGAKRVVELAVSGAFHSPLMEEAADKFVRMLQAFVFEEPSVPVFSNVSAAGSTDPSLLRENAGLQMTSPVRWVQTVQNMVSDGVTRFYEVGPGRVLAGLVKRIDRNVEVIPCGTWDEIAAAPV